jgi:putative tryptophan/tyrosine transport system substrate-binding protein
MDRRRFLLTSLTGALARPLDAPAQQLQHKTRLGSLHPSTAAQAAPFIGALEKGLSDRGHIKDRTTTLEYVFLPPSLDRLAEAASSLGQRVDVLRTWGTVAAVAAKRAGVSVPVVFVTVGFPEAIGLVRSLKHPGGNFTGISFEAADETYGKRLEIAKEVVPRLRRVAALGASDDPNIGPALRSIHGAGRLLGVEVVEWRVLSAADLAPAFAQMTSKGTHAVLVIAGAFMFVNRDEVARLALAHRLPSVHGLREGVVAGGLVSLGPDLVVMAGQAASYVDKIVRGANPADLPVEQPARYEVQINLKTARALGLTIPPSLLARADQIIE